MQALIDFLGGYDPLYPQVAKGYPPEAIDRLEKALDRSLPPAYRDFLATAAANVGFSLEDLTFDIEEVIELALDKRPMLLDLSPTCSRRSPSISRRATRTTTSISAAQLARAMERSFAREQVAPASTTSGSTHLCETCCSSGASNAFASSRCLSNVGSHGSGLTSSIRVLPPVLPSCIASSNNWDFVRSGSPALPCRSTSVGTALHQSTNQSAGSRSRSTSPPTTIAQCIWSPRRSAIRCRATASSGRDELPPWPSSTTSPRSPR
jgi:hypothetical protein